MKKIAKLKMGQLLHPSSFILRATKGLTMIELLLYMGLLSIFLVVLTDMFVSILSVRTDAEATSAVEQDGRFMIERLRYDIQQATSITTPATLGSMSNSLVLVVGGDTYTYVVSENKLQLTNNLGTNTLNSSESQTTGLSFQRLGNASGKPTIALTVTLQSVAKKQSGAEVKTYQTTIGTR